MPPPRLQTPCCMHRKLCSTRKPHTTRYLSTTSPTHHPQIRPESPNFIHVPRPPQPDAPYQPHIKGILPIPRRLFPRSAPDRTTPEYLAATTPDPSPQTLSAPKPTDPSTRRLVEWKSKVAHHRRRNLRESLHELKGRKEKSDRRYAARSAAKQHMREKLLSAPTPADERFTTPSVIQSALPIRGGSGLPDPNREARVAAKRQNHATHEAYKKAERRNALHTLYMNARDFIVTEEKLEEAVEKAFDPQSKQFDSESRRGLNVWNLGYQETVSEMLGKANKVDRAKALESYQGYGGIVGERMRRLGEELTGGKM
ncbi:MAG: hypothetical protein Q9170_002673 [Blastenia crenularia]